MVAACSTALATPAFAQSGQGFTLERYEPSPAGQWSFWIDHPRYHPEVDLSAGLTLDYAHEPLVMGIEEDDGDFTETQAVVAHQLYGHVDMALALVDRLELSLSLPILLFQDGEAAVGVEPSDAAVGDPRLGALLRLVGDPMKDAISLNLGVRVWLPVDGNDSSVGDDYARFGPRLVLAGGATSFLWSFTGEFLYRKEASIGTLASGPGNSVGSELHLGLGLAFTDPEHRQYAIGPEVAFSTTVVGGEAFDEDYTSAEVLLGGHYKFAEVFLVGLAGGLGALSSPGTPDGRVILRLAYAAEQEQEQSAPVMPEPVPGDRDQDGVLDSEDACPDEHQGDNPDPQRRGCPRPDRDGDGVFDDEDQCPDVHKGGNPHPSKTGCPTIIDDAIVVDPIFFKTNKAELLPESIPVLQTVVEVLNLNPDIVAIRIEGHTDSQGADKYNLKLSKRRAKTVLTWLTKQGITRSRLQSEGYGETQPIADNETEEGRATNRRVMFVVIKAEPK